MPRLLERIKSKRREQDLEFFSYGDDYPDPNLYLKSRYLAPDSPGYDRQPAFEGNSVATSGRSLANKAEVEPKRGTDLPKRI